MEDNLATNKEVNKENGTNSNNNLVWAEQLSVKSSGTYSTLAIAGGTPTYTEDWGTNNPMALTAGTYSYTVTDTNQCVDSGSVTINEKVEWKRTVPEITIPDRPREGN